MATYHGKSAKADFGGAVAAALAWTMATIADIAESTYMGLTWKTFASGFRDATATLDCNAQAEQTTAYLGTNAALKLYINSTKYFYLNTAICTGLTETVNMNDVGKVSYDFAIDAIGGITYV